MATNTQTITGSVARPSTNAAGGIVRFDLSGTDQDTAASEVITVAPVDAVIDSNGDISIELWPNEGGNGHTIYRASLITQGERGLVVEQLGSIKVGTSGPYDLATLLDTYSPPIPQSDATLADLNAAVSDAEAARDDAQAIAYGPDPVFNTIKATGSASLPYGTEAKPGVHFTGDEDTGVRRSSANEIALTAGGTDQLKLKGGKASGAAVQSDRYDAGTNKLMKVGAFGGAGNIGNLQDIGDLDDASVPSGLYRVEPSTQNFPNGFYGVVRVERHSAEPIVTQTLYADRGSSCLMRSYGRPNAGQWNDFKEYVFLDDTVGTVSQSGGVPTGAIIERGSNANGEFVRLADGTQICTNGDAAITTPPAAFSGAITKVDGDKLWMGRWF